MVYVRLEQDWTAPDGREHPAGSMVDVDAGTLAQLQADGVVGEEPDGGWVGPSEGDDPEGGWVGPSEGDQPDGGWVGPSGGDQPTGGWVGPSGGGQRTG